MKSTINSFVLVLLISPQQVASQVYGNVEVVKVCLQVADNIRAMATDVVWATTNGIDPRSAYREVSVAMRDPERLLRIVAGVNTLSVLPSERSLLGLGLEAVECASGETCNQNKLIDKHMNLARALESACQLDYRTKL